MATRWLAGAVCGFLLALPVASIQAGEKKEFLLKYRLSLQITQEVGAGGQILTLTTQKPALKAEPPYQSREPLYAVLELGVKKEPFTLVVDSSGPGRGYDTLYLDVDRTGRISAANKMARTAGTTGKVFGPAKISVDCGTERSPQSFLFHLREYKSAEGEIVRDLMAVNAGYYQGMVSFGDQKRLVAVVDADGNGLYNDYSTKADGGGDRLLIDLNGDGKFDPRANGDEAQPLGRYVLVGDHYWRIDVAADGSALTVEPLDKPLGVIRATIADYTLLLEGKDGVFRVRGKAGTVRVPAGAYHMSQCVWRVYDKSRRFWEFSGQGPAGASLEVPAAGELKLPLGPPLSPTIAVSPPEAGRITLLLSLLGAGGESYRLVRLNNTENPPIPRARIVDSGGHELAVVVFHYG
jgi:hypothetical protein